MRFLFVSKITEMNGNHVKGQVHFSEQEPWRRTTASQTTEISTSVISEAIGQLVSWLSLRDNHFTGRPVFLFATRIDLHAAPEAPCTLDLEADITDRTDESFIFSGKASLNGQTIVEIKDCGGYFMPLHELEDPEVTKQRFATLVDAGLPANPGCEAVNFAWLAGNTLSKVLGQTIHTQKTFSYNEAFYADHFPRFPVTPIVVINEMIAAATQEMMNQENGTPISIAPVAVQDLKIKSFIKPGDLVTVFIKKVETFGNEFETIAEISIQQKRILRGRYRYRFI